MAKKILLVTIFSFFSLQTFAQDSKSGAPVLQDSDELQIKMKARNRLYPGGRDEESLQLQAQLVKPVRKISPVVGVEEVETTSSDRGDAE